MKRSRSGRGAGGAAQRRASARWRARVVRWSRGPAKMFSAAGIQQLIRWTERSTVFSMMSAMTDLRTSHSPFELFDKDRGYDVTRAVSPCPIRINADARVQELYETWLSGGAGVVRIPGCTSGTWRTLRRARCPLDFKLPEVRRRSRKTRLALDAQGPSGCSSDDCRNAKHRAADPGKEMGRLASAGRTAETWLCYPSGARIAGPSESFRPLCSGTH